MYGCAERLLIILRSCDLLADLVEEQVTMKEGETSQSSRTGANRGVVLAGVGEGAVVTLLTALTKLRVRKQHL